MQHHPFIKELYELYDLGMTDLNANLKAIDAAKGNSERALNFLLDGYDDEPILDPYMLEVQKVKYPQQRQNLELLYNLKFTNFEENQSALSQASGDVEQARKILVHKQNLQLSSSNQQSVAKSQQIASSSLMSQLAQSQQSFQPLKPSQSLRDSQLRDSMGCRMDKPQAPREDAEIMKLPPSISELNQLQQYLREELEREGIDTIDKVITLIFKMYAREKDPSTQVNARKSISKYKDILSTQIEILKLESKQLALQLKLEEGFNLEDVQDAIEKKNITLRNAQKNGDTPKMNKISGKIEKYQKIKDDLLEVLRLEKAKIGIQENLQDPKIVYPTLSLEKRLSFLSQLLQFNNLDDYSKLLANDSDLENSDAFQAVFKPFRSNIQTAKWDRLSLGIYKTFLKGDIHRHYAMKIYLMHEQSPVTSPLLMHQAYEAIQKLEVTSECLEIHEQFLEEFSRNTVQQIKDQISDLGNEFKDYRAQLVQIMKSFKSSDPIIEKTIILSDPALDQLLIGFEGDFLQYRGFKMAKEALSRKDILGASQLLRTLMGEIVGQHHLVRKFCEMYTLIIQALPDFQIALSDDQVFYTFAPVLLKNAVSELFQELKMQVRLVGGETQKEELKSMMQQDSKLSISSQDSRKISEKLEEIFFEDAKFNDILLWYLTEQPNYALIVRPNLKQIKNLKSLQQEHLEKAFSQIESKGRGPQRIADFMTVDIDIDFQTLQADIANWYLGSHQLNGKTLTLVLYDLIKKRCTFGKFITLLPQNIMDGSVEMLFTQQFFISYLLNNSDTYLRTMILMACSFFMPLPLVSYQPKQQKKIPKSENYNGSKNGGGIMQQSSSYSRTERETENETPQHLEFLPYVYEELFYCFEKHMAVLAFKVSANPNKSPQGCTTLTNYVFNRTFQSHSKSLVNYGSIEIQFDYNFEHPMFVPVADAHGLVEEEILERLYPMFNIYLIHSFAGAEHQAVAKSQIIKIHKKTENPLIFLIIHDEGRRDNSLTISQDGNIVKILFSRYSDLLEISKAKLRDTIVQHFLKHVGDFKAYESNIPARLNSLKEFSEFASEFRAYRAEEMKSEEENVEDLGLHEQMQLTEALDITTTFLTMIDENKERLRSDKVLTMNFLLEEACRLEKIMIKDTTLKSEICEQYRQRVDFLYQEMQQSAPSPLTRELRKIIDHQNYLGLTSIISKLIRSFLNLHLQPLLKKREELRTQYQMADQKQDAKDEIFKEIMEITQTLEKRWYSNEFLYREYYISELSKLRGSERPPVQAFTDYLSLASLQISQGQPFEIIDGNNLQFIKEVYQMIEADGMQQEEILVVSVIGPQSSGKSLLLNTLFGAQFLSSVGRCTRGIYGCIIDVKSGIKKTHFKKILILDSEGIQSTEALDEAFDKRVVFYILCVSHVVLICNKGEMNKNMEDTIKLATDCVMQVREKINQEPQVNIIMNNVQINENSLFNTIQSLSNSIMEMKRNEKLRQIFTIDQSNVFLLPNAFASSGNEDFMAYQPSYQFAQKVDQLRKRILSFMQSSIKEKIASYTLQTWFEFAQKFWEFTDGYSGLTEYTNLEERKEDILLCDFTKKLIAENFEDSVMKEKHEQMIYEGVNKVLDQHRGFDQTNITVIKSKIDNVLHPRIQEVEMRIQDQFRKFIDEKGIRPQIKKRRVEQLDTQIRQHFFNWQQLQQKLLTVFNQQKNKFIGDKSLQNAIDKHIQADHAKITVEEARKIFEKEWEKIESEMKKQLKSEKQVYDEQFYDIGQLYRANTRSIINIDQERALISQYKDNNSNKIIMNKLKGQKAFFFYNSKTIKPNMQQFKEQIARDKHFLSKKIDFFEENNAQKYYNWKRVVQERFNFAAYQVALTQIGQKRIKNNFNWLNRGKRKGIKEKNVNVIVSQIQEEAEHFNLEITEYFQTHLTNLEKTEIETFINEQKKLLKKDFSPQEEDIHVANVIKDYIENIKNNIEFYFKYKTGNQKHWSPNQMSYFDCYNIRDIKSSSRVKLDQFYIFKYSEQINPQEDQNNLRGIQRINNHKDGLVAINKQQTYFTIKPDIRQNYPYFTQYLEFLVQSDKDHIPSASMPVIHAQTHFSGLIDHDKLLRNIQNLVLENIFRNSKENQKTTVEDLVQELINADDPNITQQFCAMDFKTIQRIFISVEGIVAKLNEDMEPFSFIVSEHGSTCLHQIAQTYIIRIMQEVIRLTEHAPLLSFNQTKDIQRDLFIAKLTSNDKEMDNKLAERTGRHLAQIIVKELKDEQIKAFQDKIEGEQELFKLKTIIKNIENQMLQIVDGKLSNPFEVIEGSQDDVKEKSFLGFKMKSAKQEEEKKQEEFKDVVSRLKKVDGNLQFSPQEIILFYVKPNEFLKQKFNDQWTKVTEIEIKRAKDKYENRIKEINLKFQKYFQYFQKEIKNRSINLATNVFIPIDQDHLSYKDVDQQAFKVYCKKAMAIYMGLVVTKQWKAGTPISVNDQIKMIVPENMSLVTHENIDVELLKPYDSILQQNIQNELISNIENFIQSLMSEISIRLVIQIEGTNQNALKDDELIGNLCQLMRTKTLGCDQMCPLCRRQCDQPHDGDIVADRIHRCDEGHQIQGLGGNRHKLNNKAITYGCHELDETDRVFWHGNDLLWTKFKEVIYKERRWDLEDKNQGARQLIKQKNMKIWNLIGPIICDYYSLEQKIDIQFLQADLNAKMVGNVESTFYVLMLDKSGSMSSQDSNGQSKWSNLTSAVSQFFTNIEQNPILLKFSKVSIISYNTSAKLEVEDKVPSQDLLSALKGPSGNTDFNPPLNMAKNLMEKYYGQYDSIVFFMMSDGESGYPSKGVENIKKSSAKKKLKFKSIAYGGGSDSLTKMAQELDGTCEKVLEPNQLSNAFIQMIPNLYAQ